MKLKTNYHTHTKRCGHAPLSEDEDYVLAAIEMGLVELGFSDHVPLKGIHLSWMRPEYDTIEDYVNSINNLKEKYKDKIRIYVGYECEYDEKFISQYKDMLENKGIEYLICGQHCYFENGEHMFYNKNYHSEKHLTLYIDAVINAIKSGLFKYIAHADHFMNGYRIWDDFAISESKRLLEAAQEYQIPLEINLGGLRFAEYKHKRNDRGDLVEYLYPYDKFWELASEYNIKGIIGIDAHSNKDILDQKVIDEAYDLANKYNIKLIDRIDI